MFTTEHYKAIAKIILEHQEYDTVWTFAGALADYFIEDNPEFDKQKFSEACQLNLD